MHAPPTFSARPGSVPIPHPRRVPRSPAGSPWVNCKRDPRRGDYDPIRPYGCSVSSGSSARSVSDDRLRDDDDGGWSDETNLRLPRGIPCSPGDYGRRRLIWKELQISISIPLPIHVGTSSVLRKITASDTSRFDWRLTSWGTRPLRANFKIFWKW